MDFVSMLLLGIIDFLKMAVPLAIILFFMAKALSPAKKWLEKKHGLSWIKSCILLNFVAIFVVIFIVYLYFIMIGASLGAPRDPDLEFTLAENIYMILVDLVRIIIASVLLSLMLLFFEFVASLVTETQKKKKYNKYLKEFLGIFVAVIIFLMLFLFVFPWAALGTFVYIFYGGIAAPPV